MVSACSAVSALIVVTWTALGAAAQPPVPAPAAPPQRRMDYPTRPPGDPAAIERGKAVYGVNCQFCHGADTRGGDGGPSLLRSSIVLADQHGETIAPVVRAGRPGMPKFDFTDAQMADIAAFLHTFRAAGYDESRVKPPSIVVGDAKAGEAFFQARCSSCHSTTGDLHGLASKFADPRLLQQTWLMPGSGAGRGAPPPVEVAPITVTVTLPSGEIVNGRLDRVDDFVVSLTQEDGTRRSFRTTGDTPKVELHDPLQPHRDLLRVYTDADIHNVTAFLVTLK
jgi:cytochrome c oxidase cbb3-type subunit III